MRRPTFFSRSDHAVDPARGDFASSADFSDPDGNSWMLQERGYRPECVTYCGRLATRCRE
jgi:hypothetical protein